LGVCQAPFDEITCGQEIVMDHRAGAPRDAHSPRLDHLDATVAERIKWRNS
jgi:hypothetical protein